LGTQGQVHAQPIVRVVEPVAEQVLELVRPGPDRLRMYLESFGDLGGPAESAQLLAVQLKESDSDIRELIPAVAPAAREVTELVRQSGPNLGVLMANLLSTSRVLEVRQDGLEQLLVMTPKAAAAGSSVVRGDGAHFGLTLTFVDPPPCTSGYASTPYRDGLDTSAGAAEHGRALHSVQGGPDRGARIPERAEAGQMASLPATSAPTASLPVVRPGAGDLPDDRIRDTLPAILTSWARRYGTDPALTFLDHRASPHAQAATLTWGELDRGTGVLATFLRRTCRQGDRAALLMEQGTDYVVAFLGAIRAVLIAVPLFPTDQDDSWDQLANAMADAAPAVILTTASLLAPTRSFLDETARAPVQLAAIDTLPPLRGGVPQLSDPGPDDLACLQYEPGSVGRATAVMFSHANLVAGARQAAPALGVRRGHTTSVNWLPLFQHLGLMLGLVTPLVAGTQAVLMRSQAFHEDPLRWLHALADHPARSAPRPTRRTDCA
jgi:hypothetical protein